MEKFTDKLCDLIVKCARLVQVFAPVILGTIAAYFIALLIYAIVQVC